MYFIINALNWMLSNNRITYLLLSILYIVVSAHSFCFFNFSIGSHPMCCHSLNTSQFILYQCIIQISRSQGVSLFFNTNFVNFQNRKTKPGLPHNRSVLKCWENWSLKAPIAGCRGSSNTIFFGGKADRERWIESESTPKWRWNEMINDVGLKTNTFRLCYDDLCGVYIVVLLVIMYIRRWRWMNGAQRKYI